VFPSLIEFIIMALPLLIPLIIYVFFIMSSIGMISVFGGLLQMLMMVGFFIMPITNKETRKRILNTIGNNKYFMFVCLFILIANNTYETMTKPYNHISLGLAMASIIIFLFNTVGII